jgi:hypothetical protein
VRVAELENELKKRKLSDHAPSQKTPEAVLDQSSKIDLQGNQSKRWHWEGIWTTESHTGQLQYYGPSSSFHFINEIRSHLKHVLQREHLEFSSLPNAASKIFASPTSVARKDDYVQSSNLGEEHITGKDLTRPQEEYFLNMFWQLYHCTVPILDHGSFKEHYDSLWVHPQSQGLHRKPSALVDIVLALSIQYGAASADYGQANFEMDGGDSSICGRWFYHRCQMLLSSEREKPSLSTMQCYIYSAVYLWNASFFNLAHETLAVAVRAAHALGLHQKSNNHFPEAERHIFQRIWWTLFCLDTKACIDLGRPFSIHLSDVTCELPAENLRNAIVPDSRLQLTHEGLSYLEYHSQCVQLLMAAYTIHVTFYTKCTELITDMEGKSLQDDPSAHEIAGKILSESTKLLQEWTRRVPEALKNTRKGNTGPLSISRSALDIDLCIPLWLQRQRLSLELLFHNIAMSLYRPFIRSSSSPISLTPAADNCRHLCLHHAVITTDIIHQVLSETAIFNGMYQVYQYQWEAIISMLGFALFRPICPIASSINKAIQTGIVSLETFGTSNFAGALSAANVARSLSDYIDLHSKGFQISIMRSSRTLGSAVESPQYDMPMDMSLHLSDIPASFVQAKNSVPFAGPDSQSPPTTAFTQLPMTPLNDEEFSAWMTAGLHSHDQLWFMNQNVDPGIVDTNMDIWENWMNDR